jgi:hypothetical protein
MNIKNPEAESLARRLSAATGESLTAEILTSLRERLDRVEARKQAGSLADARRNCAPLRGAAVAGRAHSRGDHWL